MSLLAEKSPRAVEAYAQTLFATHGLVGWQLVWNSSVAIAGICDYSKKSVIISRHMLSNPKISAAGVADIVLHEVAHALTPGHAHDEVWCAKARELGGSGARCHPFGYLLEPKYRFSCPCGATRGAIHRRTKKLMARVCDVCMSGVSVTCADDKKKESIEVIDLTMSDDDDMVIDLTN